MSSGQASAQASYRSWCGYPDGGAALFSFLKSRGADFGLADSRGLGMFHHCDVSDAMVLELRKLSLTELQRTANPVIVGSGQPGLNLLTRARDANAPLKKLEAVLCVRPAAGCVGK